MKSPRFHRVSRPRRNRQKEWSYIKRRRRPSGRRGRPPSAIPLRQRRRLARRRYQERLKANGRVRVQILLSAHDLAWLAEKAIPADRSRGDTIMRLLGRPARRQSPTPSVPAPQLPLRQA